MKVVAFDAWLAGHSERVDRTILELAGADRATPIGRAVRYALERGGKRIRPALTVAAFEAVSGEQAGPAITELACAVELIHTYSLIHDDLPCMDNDDIRRGRPTLHRAFDTRLAVVAGAALIPLAFRVLLEAGARLRLAAELVQRMAQELAGAAGAAGMVGGQVLDLESEGRAISLEALEHLHRAKTGALIVAAARIGGLAGGADDRALRGLTAYGWQLGLAFQIADDVLDETSGSDQLGKTAGKDRAVAKATFPALLGLDQAARRARSEITQAVSSLKDAGISSAELEAMAEFAIERSW